MEPYRLSVVIEWENVLLAEVGRSQEMLKQLKGQVQQLRRRSAGETEQDAFLSRFPDPVELIVLYNDEQVDGEAVRSIVTSFVKEDDEDLKLRFIPATGMHYYDLKNFGAHQSSGDFILFLDSDVIPNDGWLATLLGSFADPDVQMVGGNCYINSADLYSKAFSLTWESDRIFDLPQPEGSGKLYVTDRFWANNVVFRRETILNYPYPTQNEGVGRGACYRLARLLEQNGIKVYRNSNASVNHPAPNGISHFFRRGVAQGRDVALRLANPREMTLRRSLTELRQRVRSLRHSVVRKRHLVGLPAWQVPMAFGVGLTYNLLRFYGERLTYRNPEEMRHRFQI